MPRVHKNSWISTFSPWLLVNLDSTIGGISSKNTMKVAGQLDMTIDSIHTKLQGIHNSSNDAGVMNGRRWMCSCPDPMSRCVSSFFATWFENKWHGRDAIRLLVIQNKMVCCVHLDFDILVVILLLASCSWRVAQPLCTSYAMNYFWLYMFLPMPWYERLHPRWLAPTPRLVWSTPLSAFNGVKELLGPHCEKNLDAVGLHQKISTLNPCQFVCVHWKSTCFACWFRFRFMVYPPQLRLMLQKSCGSQVCTLRPDVSQATDSVSGHSGAGSVAQPRGSKVVHQQLAWDPKNPDRYSYYRVPGMTFIYCNWCDYVCFIVIL